MWWCYPRFDSDPVLCRLLAGDEEKGFTDVVVEGLKEVKSEYLRNTPIVVTELTDDKGAVVRITDFAPRFRNLDRIYRAPQLIRIIEPIAGLPRITIRFRPTNNYGNPIRQRTFGSNHIRYWESDTQIRLSTDAPLAYIEREASFVLTRPIHVVLGADEPFPAALATTCRDFLERTRDYWREWVRRLNLSYDWQDAMIRSAITLKLSNFEETGGIIAAHTTSIPESPGSGRTWDYRFCWLRDAYFVVKALNRIGATRTMEDFILYIVNLVSDDAEMIRPVYSVVASDPMDERIAPNLKGFRGDGPVRIGNAASEQAQHDTYGSIILAVDADVLRSPPAENGRRHIVPTAGSAGPQGRAARADARCRHLGISAAGSASIRTPWRCAGPAATGLRRSRSASASQMLRQPGTRSPIGCMRP